MHAPCMYRDHLLAAGPRDLPNLLLTCWLQALVWVTFLLLPYTSKRTAAGPVKPKQPGLKGAMSTISSAGAKKVGGLAMLDRFQSNPFKVSE